jgi:DNA mismatch repair protein MutS2
VLARAEERVPTVERDVNALLQTLEARDREMAARERELVAARAAAEERASRLAERETRLRERERSLEKESRRDARKYLLEARTTIENTIRELRRGRAEATEELAREARRRVETLAARQNERLDQLEREEANVQRRQAPVALPEAGALQPGDAVAVLPLEGRTGRVVELREDQVVVALGGIKVTYPRAALRRTEAPRAAETAVAIVGDVPEVTAATEVDLRGMRVDELDEPLMQALDAAIRADLRSLRIIHGKGTGALRERVGEMLRKDTRVKTFRLGLWNEGGAGVTVADL